MRKPQRQPSLASLTEADREQLADWLRREDYKPVLERVNKPRPEGFGLDISIKPLQTFYAKVALLDLINLRLSDDKKITLATFESLAQRDILLLASADPAKIADTHDAILATVHHLATSGDNTPTQLLALQRLADFPERAAIREERLQLQRAKEERALQMHEHKIAMDLRKEQRAIEMQNHRKRIDNEKLEINKRHLQLAENKAANSKPNSAQPQADEFGPLALDWDDISERARIAQGVSKEEWARRDALHDLFDQNIPGGKSFPSPDSPTPSPNPSPSALPASVNPSALMNCPIPTP